MILQFNVTSLSSLIKLIKYQRGLTTKEMADELGIGYVSLSKVEANQRKCGDKLIKKLAGVYGLSYADLFKLQTEYNSKFINETDDSAYDIE